MVITVRRCVSVTTRQLSAVLLTDSVSASPVTMVSTAMISVHLPCTGFSVYLTVPAVKMAQPRVITRQENATVKQVGKVSHATLYVMKELGEKIVSGHVTVISMGHVINFWETVYVILGILGQTAAKSVQKGSMGLVAWKPVSRVLMVLFVTS